MGCRGFPVNLFRLNPQIQIGSKIGTQNGFRGMNRTMVTPFKKSTIPTRKSPIRPLARCISTYPIHLIMCFNHLKYTKARVTAMISQERSHCSLERTNGAPQCLFAHELLPDTFSTPRRETLPTLPAQYPGNSPQDPFWEHWEAHGMLSRNVPEPA